MAQEKVLEMKKRIDNYIVIIRKELVRLEIERQSQPMDDNEKIDKLSSQVLNVVDCLGDLTGIVTIFNTQVKPYADKQLSGFILRSDEFNGEINRYFKSSQEMYTTMYELLRVCTFHLNIKEIWIRSVAFNLVSLNETISTYIGIIEKIFSEIERRKQFQDWRQR